ncbi:MAG TPA: hypothetical protein VKS44_14685 [Candidatus Acidoferrales bacterium]|nr:hypothetical protein [Candidatus Acidoferrales bacterium]
MALRWNNPYTTVLWGRSPMVLLTLALGLALYCFGSKLGGGWGGLLCLASYVSYPAFLAFGPLILTVYFVLSWKQPTDSLQRLGTGVVGLFARRLLMPPWLYLRGLAVFLLMSSRGTFILGHSCPHGVWFYFPALFILKSTLAFLVLLVLAAAVAAIAKRKLPRGSVIPAELRFHWPALWVFLAVFVVACLLSRLDLSIRHFTVPIALIILALAPIPHALEELKRAGWRSARILEGVAVLLAAVSIVTAIRAYPHCIPFLNSLSFGRPGYTLVNDSNLDWNQSLPEASVSSSSAAWRMCWWTNTASPILRVRERGAVLELPTAFAVRCRPLGHRVGEHDRGW